MEELLDLNNIEIVLKKIWNQYPEFRYLTSENAGIYEHVINENIDNWTGPPIKFGNSLKSADYLEDDMNIAIYNQLRYLPPIVHTHEFFEMTVIVKGDCTYEILSKEIDMEEGDVMIISPELEHSISVSKENSLFMNILIRKSAFQSSFLNLFDEDDVLSYFFHHTCFGKKKSYILFKCGGSRNIMGSLYALQQEYNNNYRYRSRMLETLLTKFFIVLLRYHEKDTYVPDDQSKRNDVNIALILKYIQKQYSTATLSSTAKFFNYSDRQMGRIIKENTGLTYTKLLKRIKMKKAENLLTTDTLTIREICDRLGYSDIKNFYDQFKKKNGCTPAEYRHMYNQDRCRETL